MFNQRLCNPTALHAGINEQTIVFTFTIFPWLNRCKSDDRALPLRNEDSTSDDLLSGHPNRVRMRE